MPGKLASYSGGIGLNRIFSHALSDYSIKDKTSGIELRHEIILKNISHQNSSNLMTDLVYSDDVYKKIIETLTESPLVHKIFILRNEEIFSIWTSLSKYDRESRRSFYNRELELMKFYANVEYHFDFHLAYPNDVKELLSSSVKEIFSRK
jgi:hypothetical protein